MHGVRYPVVELRQYTLRPGQREVLIDLFDREFVESQEAAGMAIVGQFRDLDEPDRFVWMRGFPSMPARAQALAGFYGGPAWEAHSAQANATMIDTDNVLLLRPVTVQSGFPAPAAPRHPVGHTPARALSRTGDALLSRPPVRQRIRRLLRPPCPPGARGGRSHAAGVPADRIRGEHVPCPAGPQGGECLHMARAFLQPSPPQQPSAATGTLHTLARARAARPVGHDYRRAAAAPTRPHHAIPAALKTPRLT